MGDEFRNCFLGDKGYEALKKLMRNGNDFCTDVAKCFQDRSDAEIAYVKALRKSNDTLQRLAGRTKGTLAEAFTTLATQTSKESDGHSVIAETLLNEISIPLKNLAEAQWKERKSIEDTLNGKFKEWNAEKAADNKYRTRQFEKCKEIETLALKISEASSSTTKSSARSKASSVSAPLVRCVLPNGRTSASEKLEDAMKKAEGELERIEIRYHLATRNVELFRQACDIEMSRSCDQIQQMELNRITDIAHFIRTYTNSIQTLNETMSQVTQSLYSIQVIPSDDIIIQARSNQQSTEIELLLYDIYAENKDNVMNEQRRILSLMSWIERLKRDIEIQQQQNKNASISSLSSAPPPHQLNEEDLPDDDQGSSSDGAMCSKSSRSKTDIVRSTVRHQDGSSSSSNDDDGAMHHTKRERKKKEGSESFSSEMFIDRRGVALLEEVYRASLYKIESVYNHFKRLSEPRYQYAQQLARTSNDKGYPTTFLRLPSQTLTQPPPSAPSATKYFAQVIPMFVPASMQQPIVYAQIQTQAPSVGWAVQEDRLACAAPDDQMVRSAPTYPAPVAQSSDVKHVRALYPYKAEHKDELDIEPGDVIMLLGRRKDKWCKGNLHGKIGLFPGNFVEEL